MADEYKRTKHIIGGAYSMVTGNFMDIRKDQAPTLLSRDYKSPSIVGYKEGQTSEEEQTSREERTYSIQGNMIGRADKNGPQGSGINEDVSFTLNATDRHGVAVCIGNGQTNQSGGDKTGSLNCMHDQQAVMVASYDCRNDRLQEDVSGTLQSKSTGGYSLNYQNPVVVPDEEVTYTVRRLTPLECERLQGFPDGWTDIGAWTDSKGKLHKSSSDSARYKALGNSIAIPPWSFVLSRLCENYDRSATLGSLFDGIGGFPLIWERINGKGSCKWTSEIEEFPIAVTDYHFNKKEE